MLTRESFGSRARARAGGGQASPRALNLLASRAASLGRLRLGPPSPETGVARRPAAQAGSRGGGALRFGARYGSSDSPPRECLPATPPLRAVKTTRVVSPSSRGRPRRATKTRERWRRAGGGRG